MKELTLSDQATIVNDMVKPLLEYNLTNLPDAYQHCTNTIAECELLISMLRKLKSDMEYELLEHCETPNNYWDI